MVELRVRRELSDQGIHGDLLGRAHAQPGVARAPRRLPSAVPQLERYHGFRRQRARHVLCGAPSRRHLVRHARQSRLHQFPHRARRVRGCDEQATDVVRGTSHGRLLGERSVCVDQRRAEQPSRSRSSARRNAARRAAGCVYPPQSLDHRAAGQGEPMIHVIAASITLAAAGQSDTNSVWMRLPGGPGTGCAHDSSYAFFVHQGDDHRLAIFPNGGGPCWNGMNCDLHAPPTYHPQLDSTDIPDTQGGIFDLSNPRNPIRDYTIAFIPYCTGDVFLGGRTVSYTSTDTTGAAHEIQVRHQGRANADQAGAIASPFYASQVARHYPKARIVQLGDGAGGYRAPPIPGILALWAATTLLRGDSVYRGVDSASLTFETIYEVSARTTPRVTFAQYNSAEDGVQLSFLALLGVHGVRLAGLLAANLADIRQVNPALRTYTSPGPMHTILRRPEFYSLTVDGVPVRDWVADLLDGKHVSDVGQSLLAPNTR